MKRNSLLGFLLLLVFSTSALSGQVSETWVIRSQAPPTGDAIAIDAQGNIYVTGAGGGRGWITAKYDPEGNELWVSRYDGAYTPRMVIDGQGDVYLTGSVFIGRGASMVPGYVTVKYDTDGNQIWEAIHMGGYSSALAVDDAGQVYVTGRIDGGRGSSYGTIKYNSRGQELWVARYNSPQGNDDPHAIAIDSAGNVYVTGGGLNYAPYVDYTTIKYDSDGHELWVARYDGPEHQRDNAYALALDGEGNVYVTGWSDQRPSGGGHYATVKYDPEGNQVWAAIYRGPRDLWDYAVAIALDSQANVYVTGSSCDRMEGVRCIKFDYATVKYDADGQPLWAARYNESGFRDTATAMALDTQGNVYVTGTSGRHYLDSWLVGGVYATVKYDTEGQPLWVARYRYLGQDFASALVGDGEGNVFVTGSSCLRYQSFPPVCLEYESATIKYSQP